MICRLSKEGELIENISKIISLRGAVLGVRANQEKKHWWQSLPFAYQDFKISIGSRPVGFRFSQSIVNIEAKFQDTFLLTCGEASDQSLATTKALAELLERTAMKEWSTKNPQFKIKSSNGWAAHQSKEDARLNAIFERVERDAVLAQWYSKAPFFQIANESLPQDVQEWANAELSQSEFSLLRILISTQGIGPSVTCILMNEAGFGVTAHAAKSDLKESIESAIAEACRAAHHYLRRSFWSDSLKLKFSDHSEKIQPGAHAVYYAYHEPLPLWMFGEEMSWAEANQYWREKIETFVSHELSRFSFQCVVKHPLFIGYATHPEIFEIIWGPTDPAVVSKMTKGRRSSFLNERTLNLKPHIVS